MDAPVLLEILKSHIESIDRVSIWFVLLMITFLAVSFSNEESYDLLGLKLKKKYTGLLMAVILIGLQTELLRHISSIQELLTALKRVDDYDHEEAVFRVIHNPGFFNLFSNSESHPGILFSGVLKISTYFAFYSLALKLMRNQTRRVKTPLVILTIVYSILCLMNAATLDALRESLNRDKIMEEIGLMGTIIGLLIVITISLTDLNEIRIKYFKRKKKLKL